MKLHEEINVPYGKSDSEETKKEDAVIKEALQIIEKRMMHVSQRRITNNAYLVAKYYRLYLGQESKETFVVLALDSKHKVIDIACEFKGQESSCSITVRTVIRKLLQLEGCVGTVLVHNHPSGSVQPSPEDRSMTKRIKEACSIVGIELLDHVIVSFSDFYSFADDGIL